MEETAHKILNLGGGGKQTPWFGYATACHLNGSYALAKKILDRLEVRFIDCLEFCSAF